MEGLEFKIVELACHVSEKRTKEINEGNEVSRLSDSEKIEVYSDKGSFAEDDWKDPNRMKCQN